MPTFFKGRLWVSPATMSVVDDSAMYNRNLSVGNVLAIVGKADGGEPFKALRFGSASQAAAVLRNGEGLRAVEKAFDPSAETGGPAEVVFVRVNPAQQALLTLRDSLGEDCINLMSSGYGRYTNEIKVKVENASVAGIKLTTQLGNDFASIDNINRRAFSLTYSGPGASVTTTITATSLLLVVDGVTVANLTLADYGTIGAVADRINSVSGFTAIVLDGNTERSSVLDAVSAQSVKNVTYTVTGNLQAAIDWLNSAGEGFITATRATNGQRPPAPLAFTYLSGGTDGSVTNSEWQQAFDALQAIDVQWVVPVSPLAAIHAMADTHCAYMSNVALMERRCIVGTDVGTTDQQAIDAAKALNSDRTSLTHLGFYDFDSAGKLVLYPPYVLAALLCGAFSGVNPGTALTNKSLKVRGLERKLRNPTDTDQLINGGVLCVEDTQRGYKVVQSITTWLVNENYNRVEVSVGVAVDFVARNIRNALDVMRGAKATPAALSEAISRTDSALRELSRPEPIGPGVIVGDKLNPAYKGIQASIEGDVLRVEFQCSPVIPINYIPIVIHAVPYSGSVSQ